jgi:predicted amidohydrolase YtcJ
VLDNPGPNAYILAVRPVPGRPSFDIVVRGGRIHPTPGDPIAADAIAIRGDTIVSLDSWQALRSEVGPDTQVLDAGGRTITPAFIDSHTHLHRAAVVRHCFLDFDRLAPGGIEDVLEHIRQRAAGTPVGTWIQGDSLSPSRLSEGRFPDRRDLDRAVPDRPVILRGIGKHVVAANSAALAAGGIDAATSDPPGGRIERDEAGEPTGILHEAAKLRLDQSHPETPVPAPSAADRQAALRIAYRELHAAGIATIHEMIRLPEEAADHTALRTAGQLGVRVRLFYRVHETPLSLDWLVNLGIRRGFGDDWLKVLGVKVSVDGFCIVRNAAVEEPYRGEPTNRGLLRVEPARLDDLVARANAQGLQVAIHAVGPRAVDLALDAFEHAGPPSAPPYRLEHAYLDIGRDRLHRARAAGAAWSVQPAFLDAYRREWADAFEPERVERIMPLATGVACGLSIQFNSDVPCAPFDPLDAIRLAVTRRRDGQGPVHPQGVDATTAWRAFTTTPADIADEPRLGRLAAGALADLVVVDGDPFGAGSDLGGVAVRATMVGGRLVHDTIAMGG